MACGVGSARPSVQNAVKNPVGICLPNTSTQHRFIFCLQSDRAASTTPNMNPNTALSPPSLILRAPFGSALGLSFIERLRVCSPRPSASPDVESPRVEFRGPIPDFPFDRLMAVSTVERLISRFALRPLPFILRALRMLRGAIPGFQVHLPPSQTRKGFFQSMRLGDRNERRITHLNYFAVALVLAALLPPSAASS